MENELDKANKEIIQQIQVSQASQENLISVEGEKKRLKDRVQSLKHDVRYLRKISEHSENGKLVK
jgi:uncharacterized heparinase superfamily protein